MPLSIDPNVVETSNGLVSTLRAGAGPHPSFRPAHAKGRLLTGTFTPSRSASSLSRAPHFSAPSTSITVRFSSSTGLPSIPDTAPSANPRGIAIRFHLPDTSAGRRAHTDIIAHSTRYFPTRTGAEFLEFLRAAGGPEAASAVPEFLGRHPETGRFLADPKPAPASFARERYWGVNAFWLVGEEGKKTAIRYQVVPVAGVEHLSEKELEGKSETYLFDEIEQRIGTGAVEFKLLAQVAAEGDPTDDATKLWSEEREVVELGVLKVNAVVEEAESLKEQKKIIFDPIPRVDGVEPSDDPLLDVRASVYLISGKQRREAKDEGSFEGGEGDAKAAVKAAT